MIYFYFLTVSEIISSKKTRALLFLEMSTQRKFNYSFRHRSRNITEPVEPDIKKTETSPMNPQASDTCSNDDQTKKGPSFPSDCEPDASGSQKLPEPDQPISAADLEHRKSAIRGEF